MDAHPRRIKAQLLQHPILELFSCLALSILSWWLPVNK
jgi:hypothetical protein